MLKSYLPKFRLAQCVGIDLMMGSSSQEDDEYTSRQLATLGGS